jgi:two-component system CheB/CheR fusion protein
VIPGDVGRPSTDLSSPAADAELLPDARKVLASHGLVEREVQTRSGAWFVRRVIPYRTHAEKIGGVVITFQDVTERRRIANALTAAKREAELASTARNCWRNRWRRSLRVLSRSKRLLEIESPRYSRSTTTIRSGAQ